jgi:catechol 2,3-dioxygenase-like lactoylglutathione lyase family enzyme
LTRKGYPIDDGPKRGKYGNIQVWVTDPDGVRIELMETLEDFLQLKTDS